MGGNPMLKATLQGAVLQGLMVLVGKFVPALGQMPNFYSICGTIIAVITGVLSARMNPGAASGQAAVGGAVAGGTSSVIGGALAAVTGQWPGFQIVQLLFPLLSGGVGGGVGALINKFLPKPA